MSSTNAMQKARQISESNLDPIKAHFDALGGYDDEVLHSQVLCMGYVRPSRTKGGILLTDKAIEEDRFQGKIYLVVAMGPGAFKDDAIAQFHGKNIRIGDWVLARPSDGMEIFYNGNSLRLFEDVNIRKKVKDPVRYW